MQQFNCVYGSSYSDVCLNTYGSLDYYIRLLNDNGLEPDHIPDSGLAVQWNETLVSNQVTLTTLASNNTIYATLLGYGNPRQVNPIINMYVDPSNATYTATIDGETVISMPALQGATIVSVTKEIKQLVSTQYTFDPNVGTITLVGTSMVAGETLFVLSKKTIIT
jgi:hypothetical protein